MPPSLGCIRGAIDLQLVIGALPKLSEAVRQAFFVIVQGASKQVIELPVVRGACPRLGGLPWGMTTAGAALVRGGA